MSDAELKQRTITLQSVTLAIESIKKQIADEEEGHCTRMAHFNRDLEETIAWRDMLANKLDVDTIQRGLTVVEVDGRASTAERRKVVAAACNELAQGGGKLSTAYLGTKNYEGYVDQSEDHKYGYCPKHGSIVFSVGLKPEFQLRRHPGDLSAEVINAALYVLNNLDAIQDAQGMK